LLDSVLGQVADKTTIQNLAGKVGLSTRGGGAGCRNSRSAAFAGGRYRSDRIGSHRPSGRQAQRDRSADRRQRFARTFCIAAWGRRWVYRRSSKLL